MNITINIPGRPKPKARPRMVRNKIWTPTTEHENAVATYMLKHQGAFKGGTGLALSTWFYAPDPRADGDNLLKLIIDAVVKAGVIDDDNVKVLVQASFEIRAKESENNPFPGQPCTRVRIGDWK